MCRPSGSSARARWGARSAPPTVPPAAASSRPSPGGASGHGGLAEQAGLELVAGSRRGRRRRPSSCSRSCRPTRRATIAARPRRRGRADRRASARLGLERGLAGDRARARATSLADGGLELVDGSISGGPPRADYRTRVYLSGASGGRARRRRRRAWLDVRVVGDGGRARLGREDVHGVGLQGLRPRCSPTRSLTAHANGVLPQVLDDLHDSFPRQIDRAARLLAVSTTKAEPLRRRDAGDRRHAGERRADAGAVRGDGRGVRAARRDGARRAAAPESIPRPSRTLEDVLETALLECGREDLNLQEPKPTGT